MSQDVLRITYKEEPVRKILLMSYRMPFLLFEPTVLFLFCLTFRHGLQVYSYGPSRTRGYSRSQLHKQQTKRGRHCNRCNNWSPGPVKSKPTQRSPHWVWTTAWLDTGSDPLHSQLTRPCIREDWADMQHFVQHEAAHDIFVGSFLRR